MRPKFFVGMACYKDVDGVYFTLQDLYLHHGEWLLGVVVVDNAPGTKEGEQTRKICEKLKAVGVRYVPMPEPVGTAAPRNRVFAEAPGGSNVLVVDCHVQIAPGGFSALADFYSAHPDCDDLIHGPLLSDDHRGVQTHFADAWGAGMWGQWARDDKLFPKGHVDARGRPVAARPWGEIPAQGLGLFACRKEAWLGFHPKFREFGGEEMYIHQKYRNAGRKVWCVTGLKWSHRFRDPKYASPFPHTFKSRCRNYVLGFAELGLDLAPLRAVFVEGKHVTEAELANFALEAGLPVGPDGVAWSTPTPAPPPNNGDAAPCCGGGNKVMGKPPGTARGVDSWVSVLEKGAAAAAIKAIRGLGRREETAVVAGPYYRIAAPVLAADRVQMLTVLLPGDEPGEVETLRRVVKADTDVRFVSADAAAPTQTGCDVLFLGEDAAGPGSTGFGAALASWAPKVRRAVAVLAPNNGHAQVLDYFRDKPEWVLLRDARKEAGLIAFSRADADRPRLPSYTQMAWSYAKFRTAQLTIGLRMVTPTVAAERYESCLTCPRRTAGVTHTGAVYSRCAECGCFLQEVPEHTGTAGMLVKPGPGKVWYASGTGECPLGLWKQETEESRLIPLPRADEPPPPPKPSLWSRLTGS